MADSVKIQIIVNGKVAVEREMVENDILQYKVGKSDGRLCHSCEIVSLNSDDFKLLMLIKPTTIGSD